MKKLPKLARRGDGVICTLPKRKRCFFWIPSLEWWKQFGGWESFLISSWHVWSRSHVLPLAQVQLLAVKSEQLSHNKSEDETAFYLVDGKKCEKALLNKKQRDKLKENGELQNSAALIHIHCLFSQCRNRQQIIWASVLLPQPFLSRMSQKN